MIVDLCTACAWHVRGMCVDVRGTCTARAWHARGTCVACERSSTSWVHSAQRARSVRISAAELSS